ncbi:MAG: metalloregulator ArsR/SmtB family transcription factor [Actinomycetota bacterium]
MEDLIQAMKAAGEPTRMRILLVLHRSELTVSELCRILGQSQPRVSRHLKLLCDAGLLHRQAEGTSAYYRHSATPFARSFLSSMRPLAELESHVLLSDQRQLAAVRADRAELATRPAEKMAAEEALLAEHRVPVAAVEDAMLTVAADLDLDHLLDIGTGTGRVLELFGPHIAGGTGIELSRDMLNLARTTLDALDLHHCSVVHGNAYTLDVAVGSMSMTVLHHVLHFLDEPSRAVEQAAATVTPGGRLLIVDFAPHQVDDLRAEHGHRRLGFSDAEVEGWCREAGLTDIAISHLGPDGIDDPALTVTIWQARQRADAPHTRRLEAVV